MLKVELQARKYLYYTLTWQESQEKKESINTQENQVQDKNVIK